MPHRALIGKHAATLVSRHHQTRFIRLCLCCDTMSADFYLRKYAEDLEDIPTPSPPPSPTALCKLCMTINFPSFFRNADSQESSSEVGSAGDVNTVALGTRLEVRQRARRCAFCFLAALSINTSILAYDRDAFLSIGRFLLAENRKRGNDNVNVKKTFCIRVTAEDRNPIAVAVADTIN